MTTQVPSAMIADAAVTQAKMAANVAGNGPAFSAYQSSPQSLSSSTATKILFQTEEFDTNNNFASSTFTPTVAGYYQVNTQVYPNTTTSFNAVTIVKNGSNYKSVQNTAANVGVLNSCLVYMNGTTDYLEVYGYFTGVTPTIYNSSIFTYFQASLARAA